MSPVLQLLVKALKMFKHTEKFCKPSQNTKSYVICQDRIFFSAPRSLNLKSGFFVYFQSQVDGKTKSLLNLLDLESSLFSDDEDELRVLDRDEDEIEVATHSKVIQPNLQSSDT